MGALSAIPRHLRGPIAVIAALAVLLLLLAAIAPENRRVLVVAAGLVVAVPLLLYAALAVDPAWMLTGGILLSVFSGQWGHLGLPSLVAPDRILLATGMVAVVARVPSVNRRPYFQIEPVHWLLVLAAAYVLVSAAVGDRFEADSLFRIFDRYGIVPFAMFLVAPLAFHTAKQRRILLGGLVIWGAYLGMTALLEEVGADALVLPKYILDDSIGLHADRARGPFLEAVTNGEALFVSAVASAVGVFTWKLVELKWATVTVGVLCLTGTIFTLQRSVWVGCAVAIFLTLLLTRELRRFLIPGLALATLGVLITLVIVPGLSERAEERRDDNQTVYDRRNLNRAALNMIEDRPLLGFGWEHFSTDGPDRFELDPDFPLTAADDFLVHNMFLSHGAELGLIGASLWLAAWAIALGGAIVARAPPSLRPWQIGLLAIVVQWLVVANFVYPLAYPILVMWTWAGIVHGHRLVSPAPDRLHSRTLSTSGA